MKIFIIFADKTITMSLIKSISGIRGTIGGKSGEGLSPLDIVKFTAAYATWISKNNSLHKNQSVTKPISTNKSQ